MNDGCCYSAGSDLSQSLVQAKRAGGSDGGGSALSETGAGDTALGAEGYATAAAGWNYLVMRAIHLVGS